MSTRFNLRVGRPDTTPDAPAHVPGVGMGGSRGSYSSQAGWERQGKVTMEAATGINPRSREPIDSRMPTLPPP